MWGAGGGVGLQIRWGLSSRCDGGGAAFSILSVWEG